MGVIGGVLGSPQSMGGVTASRLLPSRSLTIRPAAGQVGTPHTPYPGVRAPSSLWGPSIPTSTHSVSAPQALAPSTPVQPPDPQNCPMAKVGTGTESLLWDLLDWDLGGSPEPPGVETPPGTGGGGAGVLVLA